MKQKLILLATAFIILCFFFFLFYRAMYLPRVAHGAEEKLFSVDPGQSVLQIAKNLEDQGFIRNRLFFVWYVSLRGEQSHLQAGEYTLHSSMSIHEIAEKLIGGEVTLVALKVPEGWSVKAIAEEGERIGLFSAQDFSQAAFSNPSLEEKYPFLRDIPHLRLEGFLFPDTYYLTKGKDAKEIVELMVNNFDTKLNASLKEEIQNQQKTVFEVVIMASLLEKEVKTKEEKEIVSGILWKRIRSGIPLQVDATILYLTGRTEGEILQSELGIDSPYNTYKYRGLPLGPISNPGMESILAALHPKESPYWYYLSAPDGKTYFSKTLEEHAAKKARYLR